MASATGQAQEGGQEWREGSVGIVFVRPPRRRMPFAARLSALLAVALVRSRSAEVPSGAMPEATARTGVEIRLGFPAGARVNEAELRGAPLQGQDGVASLTLRLEMRSCSQRTRLQPHHTLCSPPAFLPSRTRPAYESTLTQAVWAGAARARAAAGFKP